MWEISFNAPDAKVRMDSINLLKEIYYSILQRKKIPIQNITQDFVNNAMKLYRNQIVASLIFNDQFSDFPIFIRTIWKIPPDYERYFFCL